MRGKWTGLAIVAAMAAFSLTVFSALPAEIPVHWDIAGRADATLSRFPGAFLMVALGAGIWLLFLGLPAIDPRRDHYAEFWGTYWFICNLVLLYLAAAHVLVLGVGLGWAVDVVQAVLVGMGILFAALGGLLPRLSSNWWTGIRTPWTLSSEEVWRRTHRLGGRVFTAGGVLIAVGAFLAHPIRLWAAGTAFVLMVAVPIVYSYVAWRAESGRRGGSDAADAGHGR